MQRENWAIKIRVLRRDISEQLYLSEAEDNNSGSLNRHISADLPLLKNSINNLLKGARAKFLGRDRSFWPSEFSRVKSQA